MAKDMIIQLADLGDTSASLSVFVAYIRTVLSILHFTLFVAKYWSALIAQDDRAAVASECVIKEPQPREPRCERIRLLGHRR